MNTLLIYAKDPRLAKSRLRNTFSDSIVTRLAGAFLRDTLEQACRVEQVEPWLLYTPAAAEPGMRTLASECGVLDRLVLHAQVGETLGDRLQHGFDLAFERGARAVVAMGSDSPTLSSETIADAFEHLRRRSAVIGPARDGGYYLIGLTGPLPAVWQGVSWSTSRVSQETVDRLESLGVGYSMLPPGCDVDTPADLETLKLDLVNLRKAGRTDLARHTERTLALV